MNKIKNTIAVTLLLAAGSANAAFIEMFDASIGGGALDSIADAQAIIDAAGGVADYTANADYIDFDGDTFPGSGFGAPPDDIFVMRVTGTLDTSAYARLAMIHDDGFVVRLDGSDFFAFDGNTAPTTTISGALGDMGVVSFEMIYWDQGGAQVARLFGLVDNEYELAYVGDVPEPGTLALLGAGLIGFGAARRRRTA